jgi:VanZ family protein
MRFIIVSLTIGYVTGIFLLADTPIVHKLQAFNPYSLLHLPLYGFLAVLLFFIFTPAAPGFTLGFNRSKNSTARQHHQPMAPLPNKLVPRFLGVGIISLGVAIADEIHQSYIPGRDASLSDVLLDMAGILLVMLLIMMYYKKKRSKITNTSLTQ